MTIKASIPICFWCKHLDAQKQYDTGKMQCHAFPDRIPDEIWNLEYDHREAYPNDNGIQFEKEDDYSKIITPIVKRLSYEEAEYAFKKYTDYLTKGRQLGLVKPPVLEE